MVSQWEKDDVKPPIDRMLKLREHYHFKLDWLYCEDGDYRPDVEKLYTVAESLPAYAVDKLIKDGIRMLNLSKLANKKKLNKMACNNVIYIQIQLKLFN